MGARKTTALEQLRAFAATVGLDGIHADELATAMAREVTITMRRMIVEDAQDCEVALTDFESIWDAQTPQPTSLDPEGPPEPTPPEPSRQPEPSPCLQNEMSPPLTGLVPHPHQTAPEPTQAEIQDQVMEDLDVESLLTPPPTLPILVINLESPLGEEVESPSNALSVIRIDSTSESEGESLLATTSLQQQTIQASTNARHQSVALTESMNEADSPLPTEEILQPQEGIDGGHEEHIEQEGEAQDQEEIAGPVEQEEVDLVEQEDDEDNDDEEEDEEEAVSGYETSDDDNEGYEADEEDQSQLDESEEEEEEAEEEEEPLESRLQRAFSAPEVFRLICEHENIHDEVDLDFSASPQLLNPDKMGLMIVQALVNYFYDEQRQTKAAQTRRSGGGRKVPRTVSLHDYCAEPRDFIQGGFEESLQEIKTVSQEAINADYRNSWIWPLFNRHISQPGSTVSKAEKIAREELIYLALGIRFPSNYGPLKVSRQTAEGHGPTVHLCGQIFVL